MLRLTASHYVPTALSGVAVQPLRLATTHILCAVLHTCRCDRTRHTNRMVAQMAETVATLHPLSSSVIGWQHITCLQG